MTTRVTWPTTCLSAKVMKVHLDQGRIFAASIIDVVVVAGFFTKKKIHCCIREFVCIKLTGMNVFGKGM